MINKLGSNLFTVVFTFLCIGFFMAGFYAIGIRHEGHYNAQADLFTNPLNKTYFVEYDDFSTWIEYENAWKERIAEIKSNDHTIINADMEHGYIQYISAH